MEQKFLEWELQYLTGEGGKKNKFSKDEEKDWKTIEESNQHKV